MFAETRLKRRLLYGMAAIAIVFVLRTCVGCVSHGSIAWETSVKPAVTVADDRTADPPEGSED